jgi:hypothetical protein
MGDESPLSSFAAAILKFAPTVAKASTDHASRVPFRIARDFLQGSVACSLIKRLQFREHGVHGGLDIGVDKIPARLQAGRDPFEQNPPRIPNQCLRGALYHL